LFGRTDKPEDPTTAPLEAAAEVKKGRPTPSRKEAEAAARERARASSGTDKKGADKMLREKRADANRKMREGMKSGDEKFLPARDQGPLKRAIRDWVDSRLMFTEFVLPVLVLILITGSMGGTAAKIGSYIQLATIFVLLTDVLTLRIRMRKALKEQFPDETFKGTTFYALTRMLQLRFMRLPKPKVKLGGTPV
jgi:hypothetical protein